MRTALLTGTAALLLAGYAGLAAAQTQDSGLTPATHVLTLRLPDGRLEQVRYAGEVPPTVVLEPDPVPASLEPGFPFAMLRQMTAAMDREAAALIQGIDAMTASDAGADAVMPVMGGMPVSSGPGVCMRSVQITFSGNGQAPHIVSRTAGDCGSEHHQASPAVMPSVPAPKRQTPVIEASAAASPYQRLVHAVSDWQR